MSTSPGGPLAAASSAQETAFRQLTDRRWWLLPLLGWTLLVGLSLLMFIRQIERDAESTARQQGRDVFRMVEAMRLWNASHGGVLVRQSESTPPNPYLRLPERDPVTTSGIPLTTLNPAYMTRLLAGVIAERTGIHIHLTSLRPINPANAPDTWERAALEVFATGQRREVSELQHEGSVHLLRYMAPLIAQKACITCHGDEGLRVGDVRGGISVAIPAGELLERVAEQKRTHLLVHALVWAVVLLLLVRHLEVRREQWLRLHGQAATLEVRVGERTRELAGEITARRHAEEEIRHTHQRFVDLVDSTDGIVWEADARTFVFSFVSRKAETLLGYPVTDWLQPGFWVDHLHPEDRTWAPDYCASCTRRLEPHRFEYRFLSRDGQVVWLEDIVTVVAEDGEPVALRGLMVDITARKRADEEVHRLGQRLGLATRAARIGIWEEQRGSQRVIWDATMFEMFGLDPETFGGHYADIMRYVDAEDRPQVQAAVDALVATGDSLHVIFRIHRPDGEIRFIEAHGALQSGGEDGGERLVGVCRDVTERKRNERELERLAITDGLTGCYNRGFLQKALEQEIEQVRRHPAPLSLIMADLDHFKAVNDSFGHAAGDRVLTATADLVRDVVRRSDLFCRWGGEEFLLLCPHTPPAEAAHLAERVLAALRAHGDAEAGVITASLGVASWRPGESYEALLRRVDDLMYRAKAHGRNRICSDQEVPADA